MEERKVAVDGDIGVHAELGLSDVSPSGTEALTAYERSLLDGARVLIRARIEALLAEAPDAEKE